MGSTDGIFNLAASLPWHIYLVIGTIFPWNDKGLRFPGGMHDPGHEVEDDLEQLSFNNCLC